MAGSISIAMSPGATGSSNAAVSDLVIGNLAGQLSLSATGGSSGSAGGKGGSVSVSIGRNVTVDPAALHIEPLGTSGAGGKISLTAGTSGTGNLVATGDLVVDGVGLGNGGSISLQCNSVTPFVIGSSADGNGVNGKPSANGGATAGNGGAITVDNLGSGGIVLPSIGNVSFSPSVGGGNGGALALLASSSSPAGPLTIAAGTLSADGSSLGSFAGGSITLQSTVLTVVADGLLPLTLSANGSRAGAGGKVSVTTGAADSNLVLDGGARHLNLSATGSAGTISVSAGNDLTVNNLAIGPDLVWGGNGATISLTGAGNLSVNMSLDAAGKLNGVGGKIVLSDSGYNIAVNGALAAGGAGSGRRRIDYGNGC